MEVFSLRVHNGTPISLQIKNRDILMAKSMIASLVLSLSCAACVSAPIVMTHSPDGNDVRLGQTARLDGPQIIPIKILEDSRCPINARCVRAGDVRLQVEWVRPGGNQIIEVALSKPTPMADGQLSLTSVTPGREAGSGKKLKAKDYRFSFKFDGGL
jgi:hypothetical protein